MTIMLLGGTGYLGGNIARHLSGEGHTVICVVRRTSDISRLRSIQNGGIRLISNDAAQLELTFQQDHVDWVINSVCTYKPNNSLYGDMLESNVIFPLGVLNLAIKYHVRNFLTMGTGLPHGFNVYSFTKSKFSEFGKYLSEKDGINFAELVLEIFYGGSDEPDSRFLRSCCKKLVKNETLQLTEGSQKRDIIRVEDILPIISALVESGFVSGYRALPVGSGEQHSIREIMEFAKRHLASGSELEFGALPSRAGEPDTLADISWYKEIGYKMKYGYFEGLEDYCKTVASSEGSESMEATISHGGGGGTA